MKRLLILAMLLAGTAGAARAAHASWVGDNCYTANHPTEPKTRDEARVYGEVAIAEGYEWGGGCWNDNDVDDTPNQPDSNGEGPDCSGFTFKTWHLKATAGASGWVWWSRWQNIHGPYISDTFHAPPASDPFTKLKDKTRTTTLYMDAFAKDGHVAMIYSDEVPGANLDYILEADGDAPGVGIFVEAFRGDPAYVAVRREGWAPPCEPPNCPPPLVEVP